VVKLSSLEVTDIIANRVISRKVEPGIIANQKRNVLPVDEVLLCQAG